MESTHKKVSILQSGWFSASFKESALKKAVSVVLEGKRRSLKNPNGFMSRFYDVSAHVTPFLAWGFLGTDKELKKLVNCFHHHLLGFIQVSISLCSPSHRTNADFSSFAICSSPPIRLTQTSPFSSQ